MRFLAWIIAFSVYPLTNAQVHDQSDDIAIHPSIKRYHNDATRSDESTQNETPTERPPPPTCVHTSKPACCLQNPQPGKSITQPCQPSGCLIYGPLELQQTNEPRLVPDREGRTKEKWDDEMEEACFERGYFVMLCCQILVGFKKL